jgi:two-component system, sensor histidine kinase and response regulator
MTKILVIEDESILGSEVVEWLTLEGYDAIGAEDGMQGVATAFRELPDLIICDITMPYLDGHGVLLEVRAHSATADIPFIFVTARASYEDIRTGMELGADDYLTKPFTRVELLHAIQARLDKQAVLERKRGDEARYWQEALEQERAQRLLKTKLVAMFSHDFRNPLTLVMSSNSLLRDYSDRLDEERRLMHFNRVESAVRQLLHMLDDMMFVAQMETGNLDFQPEQLEIGALLGTIVEDFQGMHNETHQVVYECHFHEAAMADRRLLRQITGNLISNAIKYSPHGSEVRVVVEQHGDTCVLTVRDQGIGIPEADQARLFDAFQRASNVGNVKGTGLGLAIVKQAVDLHQGSLEIDSKVGAGTTMIVRLPLSQPE